VLFLPLAGRSVLPEIESRQQPPPKVYFTTRNSLPNCDPHNWLVKSQPLLTIALNHMSADGNSSNFNVLEFATTHQITMTSLGFPPSMAKYFDWDSFRNTPPTLSTEQISSSAKIEIDTGTLKLAIHLCNQYPIPKSRKQELATALERSIVSKVQPESKIVLGDNLYYLLKLVNNLAAYGNGISLLCICNILGKYYPADSIVKIFEELVKESNVPHDLVPTHDSWQTLIPLFESLQGPPTFGAMVDKYTALGNLEEEVAERPELAHIGALGVVGHLMAMAHLVRGEQPWILAVASRDAGWVAAVAEWLFDLKIELRVSFREERAYGEKILYTNCEEGVKAKMVIRFNPPGVPVDREPIIETPLEVKGRNSN
jgi:hypothetical protein